MASQRRLGSWYLRYQGQYKHPETCTDMQPSRQLHGVHKVYMLPNKERCAAPHGRRKRRPGSPDNEAPAQQGVGGGLAAAQV